ncbi:D-2-hydroxyacid dehydrogenase [Photobacterium carnosum]|uniref:D-2-hydroxyacid dehydrogenase n=1 Tax=Photobacterium carnosum TaxID=2023717 RepID=UPI001E46366D|nr:D-2-hydroxyacid dehydrogenase [Photobacterium carnosum]MCD9530221.1 glycerate dehydrogenase [Photobacterium carnosum]MCF2154361.1 glycerate dehydrogenase [Photobacterium carnosum]MCF2216071.1 glycerate dehydrogenase [Photobacterium carnosum]
METIVFLDHGTIPAHISIPRPTFCHQWHQHATTTPSQVIERLQLATIAITNEVVLNSQVLAKLPQLKFIAIAATGTNNVDLDYCRNHNIKVANIQGYATRSVPEHVIAMIFALKRNLAGYQQDIANGEWQRQQQFCFFTYSITDVAGSTLGIMGKGSLGQAVATVAKALGMNVLFAEHAGATQCRDGYHPFEQVLREADIISLHCPLTPTTKNMIAAPQLALMKSSAIIINTSRGGLINEQALVDALLSCQIAGAGIDVFTTEPALPSNPLIAHCQLPNLILTPHVAWGSDSAIQTLVNQLIDNINSFHQGTHKNQL